MQLFRRSVNTITRRVRDSDDSSNHSADIPHQHQHYQHHHRRQQPEGNNSSIRGQKKGNVIAVVGSGSSKAALRYLIEGDSATLESGTVYTDGARRSTKLTAASGGREGGDAYSAVPSTRYAFTTRCKDHQQKTKSNEQQQQQSQQQQQQTQPQSFKVVGCEGSWRGSDGKTSKVRNSGTIFEAYTTSPNPLLVSPLDTQDLDLDHRFMAYQQHKRKEYLSPVSPKLQQQLQQQQQTWVQQKPLDNGTNVNANVGARSRGLEQHQSEREQSLPSDEGDHSDSRGNDTSMFCMKILPKSVRPTTVNRLASAKSVQSDTTKVVSNRRQDQDDDDDDEPIATQNSNDNNQHMNRNNNNRCGHIPSLFRMGHNVPQQPNALWKVDEASHEDGLSSSQCSQSQSQTQSKASSSRAEMSIMSTTDMRTGGSLNTIPLNRVRIRTASCSSDEVGCEGGQGSEIISLDVTPSPFERTRIRQDSGCSSFISAGSMTPCCPPDAMPPPSSHKQRDNKIINSNNQATENANSKVVGKDDASSDSSYVSLDLDVVSRINSSDRHLMERSTSPGALRLTEEGLRSHTEKVILREENEPIDVDTVLLETPAASRGFGGNPSRRYHPKQHTSVEEWKRRHDHERFKRKLIQEREQQQIAAMTKQSASFAERSDPLHQHDDAPSPKTPGSHLPSSKALSASSLREAPKKLVSSITSSLRKRKEDVSDVSLAPLADVEYYNNLCQPNSSSKDVGSTNSSVNSGKGLGQLFRLRKSGGAVSAKAQATLEKERAMASEARRLQDEVERLHHTIDAKERERIQALRDAFLEKERAKEAAVSAKNTYKMSKIPSDESDAPQDPSSRKGRSGNISSSDDDDEGIHELSLPIFRDLRASLRVPSCSLSIPELSTLTTGSTSTSVLPPCVVCQKRERTHIALPCMHFSFCGKCATELTEKHHNVRCPVCQETNVTFGSVSM